MAICGRDEDRLAAAAAQLEAAGGDVLAQRADVAQADEIQSFVDAAVARWDRIDGIVHNAGRSPPARSKTPTTPLGKRPAVQVDGARCG